MSQFVLALDQGTTSSRAILFTHDGRPAATAQRELPQHYPRPGHVEHDPEDIWETQLAVAREAIEQAGGRTSQIAAVGIANQRETVVLWDRETGRAVHNAVVWQSRASAPVCERLLADGCEPAIRDKTGLRLDPYFSGTKVKLLLDQSPDLRRRAERGEVLFGTVDSFLLWRLTGGAVHATDDSNASRTLLYDIHRGQWDPELLELLTVPREMLPEVRPTSGLFGLARPDLLGAELPIAAVAGDQQAATFGQACFDVGDAKNTYGTGCFLLMNTGSTPVRSEHGLLTTVGWSLEGEVTYCLEGSVFVAGAMVQWLRDGLGILERSEQVEELAARVPDSGGVVVVPALVGLGAPHWDPSARGAILGLSRGTTAAHVARATLESIAFQSRDLLVAMRRDAMTEMAALRVDGGATVNDGLLQFQADILDAPVLRPMVSETTALGAAYLAGLAVGFWQDCQQLRRNWQLERRFDPALDAEQRAARCRQWEDAVGRCRGWA